MRRNLFLATIGFAGCVWLGYLISGSPGVMSVARADGPPKALQQILQADAGSPSAGNPAGTVTIVEYFDYRCPYCKAMQPRLAEVLQENKNVWLVLEDWPIFGGISIYAARVAIASNWQGKYLPVHDALFALGKEMDQASVRQAAESAGVDLTRLDADLVNREPEISQILTRNYNQATALGFQGTPGFIIGNTVVPGALSVADIEALVKQSELPK
jgi:protein-disulfide isomerase